MNFYFFYAQSQLTPSNISGLKLWITGDSVHLTNGKVDTCYDLSTNQNNPTQNNNFKMPEKRTDVLNGHSSIYFDGIDDILQFNNINDIRTVFWVIRGESDNSNLLGHSQLYDFYRGNSGFIWDYIYANPGVLNGTTKVNSEIVDGRWTKLNQNQFYLISLESDNNLNADNFSSDRVIYGRLWKGDLLELFIYDTILTIQQINAIEKYLGYKYSPVSLNLGQDILVQPSTTACLPSTSVILTANTGFQNYLWSSGETTPQIMVNMYGEYSVICKDLFGVNHYDTIKVLPYKNFNYPIEQVLCGNNNQIIWDTEISINSNSFLWQDNSDDSLIIISQPGQYYVSITDTFGCTFHSDTITITQDNFPSSTSLGPDTSLCAGNAIGLSSGNVAGLSYLWNDNSTDSSLVINNSGQYTLEVTNQNNCVARDTINVTISGQAPIAGFDYTPACLNTSIQFTDTSRVADGSNLAQWFWDFGNTSSLSDTSILANPTYTFADTGSYQITLRVKSTQGCSQSIQKNIRVYPKPIVDYFSSIACQNDTTSFFSTINTLGYSINLSKWNFGDPASGNNNQSTLLNPIHQFSQAGNFQVKLVAENNKSCKDSITKTISVKNEVNANFNFTNACVGTPITFTDNSIVPAPNAQNVRLWNFYPGSSGGLSVNKTYSSAGTYSVTLTVNGFNGCTSSITKNIEVHLPPIADFNTDTICKNDTVSFQDLSLPQQGSISSWNWKINNQSFSQLQQPNYVFNSAGNFNVQLIAQNSFGCIDSITKNIKVYSLPDATISSNADPYYFISEPVQFNASSSNFTSYFWIIDSTSVYTIAQPTYSFNSSGEFSIQLTVEDSLGCIAKGNKIVSVTSRILDLAVSQATASVDTFGFAKVTAELRNLGTSPVTAFEIMYEITGTEKIKENWSGTLPPNSIFPFTFSREVFIEDYEQKNALNCIRLLSVNTKQDANLSNNQSCSPLITTENFVAEPFPNPGKNSFTIPVNLKENQTILVEITDILGKKLFAETTNAVKGINLLQLHAEKWENGVYFLTIRVGEKEVFLKKLLKN
jgi:PKD repeat protein